MSFLKNIGYFFHLDELQHFLTWDKIKQLPRWVEKRERRRARHTIPNLCYVKHYGKRYVYKIVYGFTEYQGDSVPETYYKKLKTKKS